MDDLRLDTRIANAADSEAPVRPTLTDERAALDDLARLAAAVGATGIHRDAMALADRVSDGRFNVACLGQFKRGKSSLINALVRQRVLPTGIVPITAVPTVVRYGEHQRARIQRAHAQWEEIDVAHLERYVSEEHNPENRLGVTAVEVRVPSALLASGMCLVDTPGVGSVLRGNTAATLGFVPHVDVAVVVIGVDPPLSGEELSLAEEVARHAPTVLVVLSKADRFPAAERAQAATFSERTLSARLGRELGPVLHVSALPTRNVTHDWNRLERTLVALQRESGRELVRRARNRGTARLAGMLVSELTDRRATLTRPLEDSARLIGELKNALQDAARQLAALGLRFAVEQERVEALFAERRDVFLRVALPAAKAELVGALDANPPRARQPAFSIARDVGRRWLRPWLERESDATEHEYRKSASSLIALTNEHLSQIKNIGASSLSRLPVELTVDEGFRVGSRYYYRELTPLVQVSPVQAVLDLVLPASRVRSSVRREATVYLARLLEMNSTLVGNDLAERMLESRRRLEAEIRAMLERVAASSELSLAQARAAQAAGRPAVEAATAHVDGLLRQLQGILASLTLCARGQE